MTKNICTAMILIWVLVVAIWSMTAHADTAWIDDLAGKSKCSNVKWANRGLAKQAYFKGLAQVYARQVCRSHKDLAEFLEMPPGDPKRDALAVYGLKGNALDSTFVLLTGLGMRESSGKLCCGRDLSAHFTKADSAEAGIFQTSWGARSAAVVPSQVQNAMQLLFEGYSKDRSRCLYDVFSKNVSCSAANAKNWGDPSSDGYKWQALTKSCPAFAVEYAALVLRFTGGSRGEFGPIRARKAEVRKECIDMYAQIRHSLEVNPDLCKAL